VGSGETTGKKSDSHPSFVPENSTRFPRLPLTPLCYFPPHFTAFTSSFLFRVFSFSADRCHFYPHFALTTFVLPAFATSAMMILSNS
jgi:hypothetical protein